MSIKNSFVSNFVSDFHSDISTSDRLSQRLIPSFLGQQHGVLDSSIVLNPPDIYKIEVIYAPEANGNPQYFLLDSTGNNSVRIALLKKADHTLQYNVDTTASATLDGIPINSEVTLAPEDNKVHIIELITNGISNARLTYIGRYSVNNINKFRGQLFSVKITNLTNTETVANYVFDSGSITKQEPRGDLDNNCILFNFTLDSWNNYTLQKNIVHDAGTIVEAWVGNNVVVNGTFDTDTDWTLTSGWSITGGKLEGNSAGGSAEQIVQKKLFIANTRVLISLEISDYIQGSLYIIAGTNGPFSPLIAENGTYKFIVETGFSTDNLLLIISIGNFTGKVDNISVQHILEIV